MNSNKSTMNREKITFERTQPSIRDYLLCLNNPQPPKSTSKSKAANECRGKPYSRPNTITAVITKNSTDKKNVNKSAFDIGLTTEDLLALPNSPPDGQQSAFISSGCFTDHQPKPSQSPPNLSSEIANVLAYVRGRSSESNADHDLADFDEWLNGDDGELSGEENATDELSFDWPTDDRILMCRNNGRNRNGPNPNHFERKAEYRRIDSLLNGNNEWQF